MQLPHLQTLLVVQTIPDREVVTDVEWPGQDTKIILFYHAVLTIEEVVVENGDHQDVRGGIRGGLVWVGNLRPSLSVKFWQPVRLRIRQHGARRLVELSTNYTTRPTHTTWVGWRSRCSRRPRPKGRGGGVGLSVDRGCFVLFLRPPPSSSFVWRNWDEGDQGHPTMTARARPGSGKEGCIESPAPLPWPFGPHVVGYQIKDDKQNKQTHLPLELRYHPPSGTGLRRKQLHRARKALASCYYQLLSGHAAIGSFLHDRMTGLRDWSRTITSGATAGRGSRAITCLRSAGSGPPRSGGCGKGWGTTATGSTRGRHRPGLRFVWGALAGGSGTYPQVAVEEGLPGVPGGRGGGVWRAVWRGRGGRGGGGAEVSGSEGEEGGPGPP